MTQEGAASVADPNNRSTAGSARSRIRQIPYDAQAIDLIADTFDIPVGLADFRLPGAAVYQLMVPGTDGRASAMLTLWPSIRRVDAIGGGSTIVFTNVVTVDLVAGIEVQFRRANRDYLIVAIGGRLIVRA